MFFMVSIQASAQFNFDVETVEALIRDHKNVRSVLIARNSVEQANLILHQYSRKAVEDHYQLNVELDKFTRLFDMIDIIVSGTSTVSIRMCQRGWKTTGSCSKPILRGWPCVGTSS